MINLHPQDPELILVTGKELIQTRDQLWPYFLEFCLKRNPMPQFDGPLSERQKKIADYYVSTFTMEKDLILRAEGNLLTAFVLFDPQNWSLEGSFPENTVELVIDGTLSGDVHGSRKDFKILVAAYKKYKGCNFIGMNIRRTWKVRGFTRFCESLGFKLSGEKLYLT